MNRETPQAATREQSRQPEQTGNPQRGQTPANAMPDQQAYGIPQKGLGSPISNEAYNVISTLHAKLEGLEAMRKYSADGNRLWQKMTQSDLQCVDQLVNELEAMVKGNKLRMNQPGKTQ